MYRLEKHKDKTILTIYGYVGGKYLDARTIENVLYDIEKTNCKKLDFWLHTYGGDVFQGNMIKVFMERFIANGGEIEIYCPGILASMGAVIMFSATKVHLVRNGFVMFHAPSGGAWGNAKKMEQTAKLLRAMERTFKQELKACNISDEQANEWMDGNDYWLPADEAFNLGLIDSVIDPIGKTIQELDKDMVEELGSEAVFNQYAAIGNNFNQTNMNKKDLINRFGLTSVTEASTDEDVLKAIEAKIAEQSAKAEKSEAELKALNKKSIENSVDNAIKSGKIKADKRAEYIARGEKIGLNELNAIFEDMQVYEPISGRIDGKKTEPSRADWDWNKWQNEDPKGLENLAKTNKEAFNALYKKEFGVIPMV